MFMASLVVKAVKNPPSMQETQILSLGWEDLLEKGMASHSSILVWRILWTEELGGLRSMGSKSRTRLKLLSMHTGAAEGVCVCVRVN